MKSQINILRQLQELVLTRDEHHQTGDGSHLDALNDSLSGLASDDEIHIFESHLSHFMDCRAIIVLRCSPPVLAERLQARGYSEAKVKENVQSEILDVILCEASESDIPVYEVDCTSLTVSQTADAVEAILKGEVGDYLPGRTDWSEEMERWF